MTAPQYPSVRVLIVGAGPTGLVLALSLARRGVSFRLIDAESGPGEQSRAMGVHARTLEFYRQFGFAENVIANGIIADRVHLRRHGRDGVNREAATFKLRDLGDGISPYPFMLTFPQDDHERLLVQQLALLGGAVEWRTKLIGLSQADDGVHVTLERDGTTESVEAQWVAGCDGARSTVRHQLGVGFSGGTYEQLFYVADVRIESGFDRDIYANLGRRSLAIMMPVRSRGVQRLIGLIPDELKGRTDLRFDDVRPQAEPLLGVKVAEVNWFSTYHVHHRVADRFRVGRCFIAGDAGHIHSPTGGQGMNTGIGDAINLGWKLADVVRGRAPATILDTYEDERLPFAKKLVATTDQAFEGIIAEGLKGEAIRRWLAPAVINIATRFGPTKRLVFRTFSQTAISYRDSALSDGEAGVVAGDRLPWVAGLKGDGDNFDPLRSLDWQAHIYGDGEPGLEDAFRKQGFSLHVFPWTDISEHAGLKRNALYLVRPDGYVALAAASHHAAALNRYIDRQRLNLSASSPIAPRSA